ncbi:MAG TPA: methylated-DNA--[protein]-cysteine S-methyltransferase [Dehalococcoidia bacterium]|nr:methylated-DNA--[protein]-cysteine S-methyltransferase [Dehalococcoidia bacterium]
MSKAPHELFAAATDRLIHGGQPDTEANSDLGAEIAVAERLRNAAGAGIPDPEFVAGLRVELRLQAAARSQHAASTLRYATMDTALGLLALAYRDGKVVTCSMLSEIATINAFTRAVSRQFGLRPERDAAPPRGLEKAVRDQLAGRHRFVAVDLSSLTPFHQRVLEKTAEIPRGEVRPYSWVARELGAPGAVRAVGTALGHNPVPFLIPCHRVVRSDGTLGEYSGGGPAVKERVLDFEGAPVEELRQAARSGQRYRGSRTTHIVCYPSCHAARRIQPENIVPFATLGQAHSYGYRPCSLCRPA